MKRVGQTRLETTRSSAWRSALTALLLALAVMAAAGARAQTGQIEVRVTDSGFTPAEATAAPGLVHLSLVNGSGAETVRIRIAREGGAQIREVKIEGEGAALSTELEATAGVYTLTEVAHGWVFRLTVNPPPPTPTPTPEPPAD